MSNNKNDLIRRGDVLAMAAEYECEDYNDMAVSVDDINDIPAVPQPMSAVEYARTFAQMCASHTCGKCPFHESEKFSSASCFKFEREYPEEAVTIVQKWAQEHHEEANDDR